MTNTNRIFHVSEDGILVDYYFTKGTGEIWANSLNQTPESTTHPMTSIILSLLVAAIAIAIIMRNCYRVGYKDGHNEASK